MMRALHPVERVEVAMNRIWVSLMALAAAAAGVLAEPPRVVRMWPDHGDSGVDPALSEIRVEFDQDMNPGGRSICGGGPSFPKLDGSQRWDSPRVMVIPVKLEAGHEYRLNVNCPSARNFRSAAGEPAESTPLRFTTAKPGEKAEPAPDLTPEVNARALTALRTAIDQRYSYRDRVVKDWDALLAEHNAALLESKSRAQFARRLGRMLGAARDPHVDVRIGETGFPTFTPGVEGNIDFKRLATTVQEFRWRNQIVASGKAADGVGYILINSWPGDREPLRAAHEALDESLDLPALIIDVRGNGGGDESAARAFAARFVRERTVYSRSRSRDPAATGGWGPVRDRIVSPSQGGGGKPYTGSVAVLIGPRCMSSNESFILMMREGAKATLVGARTRGSSGNPRPHDLGNGVTAVFPSWEDLFPDGSPFEGVGIEPGIQATLGGEGDGIVSEAVRALKHD
jgi:hypothetical protein